MGLGREQAAKKIRLADAPDTPVWLRHAVGLPQRLFISRAEKELFDRIRKYGELTKPELVASTEYSRTKITSSIDSLLQKKFIIENQETEYTGGRRSKTYSINGSLGYIAGVDIGATSIDLAIADFSRNILVRYSEPALVREGPIKVLGRVCGVLEKLMLENGLNAERLLGIGMGIPGPVDFSLGMAVSPPIMPGWDCYPIIQTVQQWFPNANVVIDNDVNVMALGEIHQGEGKNVSNLIFVKVGTGIGSGIVCEGRIYRGASGCAGDIGHISVSKSGPLCHCGNTGCLEAVAGGPAIAKRSLIAAQAGRSPFLLEQYERKGGKITAEDVGIAAREGDAVAIEVIRESGQLIGDVLAALVNFYNPEMIIIGGGVSNLGNQFLSSIRQAVLNRSLPLATRNLNIVFSGTGSDAGIIGAVNLAMDYIFTVESTTNSGNGNKE